MVKIANEYGDLKRGKQGEAVYQLHYGQQIRRQLKPKTGQVSKTQLEQRLRFKQALDWRKTLTRDARRYLEGFAIAHSINDDYGIPLTWDKFALKIALQQPRVVLLD